LKSELSKAGFVTRDAREVERKKLVCAKHVAQSNSPSVNFFSLGQKSRPLGGFFAFSAFCFFM